MWSFFLRRAKSTTSFVKTKKGTTSHLHSTADVVIIGAGIAGASAFYQLIQKNPSVRAILLDPLPPLGLTSSRGTFAHRNWWPHEAHDRTMLAFVSRSLDLMEEFAHRTENICQMTRNGYLFVTSRPEQVHHLRRQASLLQAMGGGELREYDVNMSLNSFQASYNASTQFIDRLDGCDLIQGQDKLVASFPFLRDSQAIAALHVRRCGWMQPDLMVKHWFKEAHDMGNASSVIPGKMTGLEANGGRVSGVHYHHVQTNERAFVATPNVVLAVGPQLGEVGKLLHLDLPEIKYELHGRCAFHDSQGLLNEATTPFTIWTDPVGKITIPCAESRAMLQSHPSLAPDMTRDFPAGVHVRPFGKSKMLAIWTYDNDAIETPTFPAAHRIDPRYGANCLFGLQAMMPGIQNYLKDPSCLQSMEVDGGYYCKVFDNRPLIGPLKHAFDGLYINGAMSGIGLMCSFAAGELLASQIYQETIAPSSSPLALYHQAFLPDRFRQMSYLKQLEKKGLKNTLNGQL